MVKGDEINVKCDDGLFVLNLIWPWDTPTSYWLPK